MGARGSWLASRSGAVAPPTFLDHALDLDATARRWHAAVQWWRDPARLLERRRRRARRALTVRAVGTAGFAMATAWANAVPGVELGELFWGSATVATGAAALSAGRRLWRLRQISAPPARPAPAPLPPRASLARPPLDRLAERERALAGLLGHLPAEAETATDAAAVAAEASAALRSHAARIAAVERARQGMPAHASAGLDAALAALVGQLQAGVAGYDALVVAAAEAVCASATLQAGDPLLNRRLAEATDALAGLAAGLRAVAGAPH